MRSADHYAAVGGLPSRPISASEDQDDSRSSSSTNSPAPADNEESDFFLNNNDSQSSVGVPNFQDMVVDDVCWPPVNRLPNEILMSIFSKLSAPADLYASMRVSKRWARNAVDMLWHRPSCTSWKNHHKICQTLGLEQPFFNYRDFIRRLNLAALADDVNDGSVQPLSACTRVERLTLTNCRNLTDSGLVALVQNSASLLALDISNDKNITEKSINAIANTCKRLQGLNVSGCENISNESMIALAQNCRFIKRLKLNECVQLRDDAIHAFADHCPNILEIDLHQCNQIGNGPITSLLAKGNCLRELRLASCDLIDDDAFLSVPPNRTFEHLRILDLTSCTRLTDAAVQKIVDVAPRLRNLVLSKCRNITDVSINAISKLGKNLHYVHLGHCGQITDEGVKRLVSSCNRIRYIDLGCCTNLTDESVKRLALLPKLKRIGLVKCSSITDESVNALAEAAFRRRFRRDNASAYGAGDPYASSLERVHLSYCVNLTLKSIMRLLNACPRLTHLSLTGVNAFQREEFQRFCRAAPQEFTQHQRDVFCVFSGSMVSQFRHFLNTDTRFEDIRDPNTMSGVPGDRLRIPRQERYQPVNGAIRHDGAEYDDEMADEENDFEGMDAGDMVIDAYAQNTNPHPHLMNAQGQGPAMDQTIPVPPPPPSFNSYNNQAVPPLLPTHAGDQNLGPLAFSSFLNSQPATGNPPLSVHGFLQASAASMRPSMQGEQSSSSGASRASMHHQPPPPPPQDGPSDQSDQVD